MPRLFIAIDLPESIKDLLETLRADLAGAVWVKRQTYHLTLRFLGDQVPIAQANATAASLTAVQFTPFDLRVRGVGRFPPDPRSAARVLWAGIEAPPDLAQLHADLSAVLTSLGFPPEDHPFHPHVTLARMKLPRPDAAVERFLAHSAGLMSDAVRVTAFHMYESELSPHGSHYTRRATFSAQEPPSPPISSDETPTSRR